MLPTPDTSHVCFNNVYEPSEDSFLLLDALSKPSETSFLSSRFSQTPSHAPLVLEVGPGSGVVLAFIAANTQEIFGRSDSLTIGVDVNEFACTATAATVRRTLQNESVAIEKLEAGSFLDCLQGDLTTMIRLRTVDVLIFNPPYVPSEDVPITTGKRASGSRLGLSKHDAFERDSRLLALATDGGVDGMEITNKLLDELPHVLSNRGVAYVLLCAQNKPEKVKQMITAWGEEWEVSTSHTSGKQGGWEKLQVIRIARRFR